MRRSLIVTVAATIVMVLLAMLVPMAVLVQNYAVEDTLARAALEVQATETVVSGQDKGSVSVYLESINSGDSVRTTVLYPDGVAIGPTPGEDDRVREARRTGQARVDDVPGGAEMLVPVALGGSTALPRDTPVIRVTVLESGFQGPVYAAWAILAVLGLALLGGSLLMADRLGRRFVQPIRSLAATAQGLGVENLDTRVVPEGPPEVREVAAALNRLVDRVSLLIDRERENVADLSHRLRTPITALRLSVESLQDPSVRARMAEDVDALERMVDYVVREARRSQREGLAPHADAAQVLRERTEFWRVLAEDQARDFDIDIPDGPIPVHASRSDLEALVDVLLDNVFSYSPEAAPVRVRFAEANEDWALTVEDGGPGFPADLDVAERGISASGSTGLGLSIAMRTARASGGALSVGRSAELGGARVEVLLGVPH